METWGLAGVGGGKDREKEKDTEEKQRLEWLPLPLTTAFFVELGELGFRGVII